MAGPKKFKYRFTKHCEDRDKSGAKTIFKLGDEIVLTKAQAKPYADVLELVEEVESAKTGSSTGGKKEDPPKNDSDDDKSDDDDDDPSSTGEDNK